jgi:hypothetical protein
VKGTAKARPRCCPSPFFGPNNIEAFRKVIAPKVLLAVSNSGEDFTCLRGPIARKPVTRSQRVNEVLKVAKRDVADHDETQHTKNFFADADSEVRFARIMIPARRECAGCLPPTGPKLQPPRYFPQRDFGSGKTALQAALESGRLEVAQLLLGRQRRTGLE